MYFKIIVLSISVFCSTLVVAQDDLFKELDKQTSKQKLFELPAFKAMQIGNLQSTKIADKNDFYLTVAHRFGYLDTGIDSFFGLDEANTRIQLTYGILKGVHLSLSRDSFEKTYSGAAKIRLVKQSNKFPLNIVGYASADIDSQINNIIFPELKFADRMSYTMQLLASKRFSKNFSFLIAPTFVRQNFQRIIQSGVATHNQFIMGFGGRIKISKRVSINVDYGLNLSRDKNSVFKDPLTIGTDIETGGHVFQLLFSNARASNDNGFLTKTTGYFFKGDIVFGFNIIRVF